MLQKGKKAIKKLEESERKYRTTFEHTGTAMTIIEGDTTLSLVNSEFEKLSGYKKEEVVGRSWTQFVHPDDLEWMKKYHFARRKRLAAGTRGRCCVPGWVLKRYSR
ncbi:MAG TPA: PAS domain S-box protein, partial [Archaeoglobaceae archaeon]|nr:PAS domain S-box protein [Archaeoglobaceae archaeon]